MKGFGFEMEDVVIRFMDYPYGIRGCVMQSPDGTYNVYLNSRYCHNQNLKTLIHELRHIHNGDLNSFLTAHEIERSAKDGSCEKIS